MDKDVSFWSKDIICESSENLHKIPGQGNSAVYKVDIPLKKSYAIKYYPDKVIDNRPRLETEFKALQILHKHNIKNVPKPIRKNYDLNIAVYEWIDGDIINKPSTNDINKAIKFAEKLYVLSKKVKRSFLNYASEACLSGHGLLEQIENRYKRLNEQIEKHNELANLLDQIFYLIDYIFLLM